MSSTKPSQPKRRARSLRRTLQLIFIALVALPVLTLTVVSMLNSINNSRQAAVNRLNTLADIQAQVLEQWVSAAQNNLSQNLANPVIGPIIIRLVTTPPEEMTTATYASNRLIFINHARVVIGGPDSPFSRIVLTDVDGIVRGTDFQTLLGRDWSMEPWFNAALQAGDAVALVGPYRDPVDGKDSLYFSTTVRTSEGEVVGVLCGRATLDPLEDLMERVPPLGETGEYLLIRQGQQYVAPPRHDPGARLATDEIASIVLSGNSGSGTWRDYRGEEVIGAYRWVAPLNMSLIVKQDSAEVLGNLWRLVSSSAIIGMLFVGLGALLSFVFSERLLGPLEALSRVATRVSAGDLNLRAPETNATELRRLADSFNAMTAQIRSMIESREETIRERTRELAIVAQMGRVIAAETNLERLLDLAIGLIRDRLGYYHVQIFMVDDLKQNAVLRASTGEAGRQLLALGHRLPVGSRSVVGQAAGRGEPVLASDTRYADYWRPNPLLPDTRAELAIPLLSGDQLIGVLDIQSTEPETFSEDTIAVLQTLADQLAVAIRNAQLFGEKESLLSASLDLTQMLTREGWGDYVAQRRGQNGAIGFEYNLSEVRPLDGSSGISGQGISLPIALRGAIIGQLEAQLPEGETWTEEDRQLVSQVLDRVALALENARLFEQTQISLAETNRLYQASQRIAAADTVKDLIEELIDVSKIDIADQITLYLVDDPSEPPGDRWVEAAGSWVRDPHSALGQMPSRLRTSQPPLKGIESIPPDGRVIDDLSAAEDMAPESCARLQELGVRSMAVFPLVAGRRTLAWLVIYSSAQGSAFTEGDVRFFETITDQAASALEGLRLFEQTQIRARRLQATNEVSRAASSILNPDILLPLIVDRISEAFGYYHVQIFLVDELGEWAVLRASTGEVGQELLRRKHALAVGSRSVIGQVTALGEVVIARDTDADAIHRRNELLPNTRAEMAIPLKTGDRVIGALDVQSTQVNAFDAEAQAILQSLADQISVTLENAQLFQEIQDRVAELTTVNLVSQTVSRAETLDDLYEVVTTQLMRTFGAQYGFLGVLGKDNLLHFPIFIEGGERLESPSPQPVGEGLSSHVIRTKQVLLLNENLPQEAERLGARVIGEMPKSLLAVPLTLGDEAIGVLSIQDAEREHAYGEAHIRQLTTLAAYIAIKIRNAELLEEAQRRAAELGFLFNLTRAAVSTSDLDEALSHVAEVLHNEIEGAEAAVIYLANAEDNCLDPRAAIGYGRDIALRQGRIEMGEGLVGMVAMQGRPLVIGDAWQEGPGGNGSGGRTRSAVLVPLMVGDMLIGVLTVESTQPNAFGELELRLLEAASGTLTAVIQNDRLLEQITRANEQLRELDKLKSQFLANMSHELRTPLNSIIGFSRVMLKGIDGPLNDLQVQDLTTIHQSGQHLLGLINDILDLSKIEAGKMEIQPEYIDLVEIIDGVMSTAKGLVKDKPIQLFKEVEEGLPQVYGDPLRVRQVLLNLVSNAAKFTKEGSITVRAVRKDFDPVTLEPPRVQVDVADTGIGIAPKDMEKLFVAFQQVDGSSTRQVGGTGLGLAISKQFIEMHGGRIWVESQVGVGSTFSFTVPLHPPSVPVAEREPIVLKPASSEEQPVVLAVDDEPGVLDLYARYLEKAGYALIGLSSANDLLRHVREVHPSAIVMDLNLPGKSGWEAITDLRRFDDTRNVPVIICSIEDDRRRGSQVGVADYLVKPIIEDELLEALSRVVNGTVSSPATGLDALDVLIIDSDEQHACAVEDVLVQSGRYVVRRAAMGFEGLQAIQEHKPDVVILELDLPDMDGYGLLVSMRSHADTRDIPVLIMTGRELTSDQLGRLDGKTTRYLSKAICQDVRWADHLSAALESLR